MEGTTRVPYKLVPPLGKNDSWSRASSWDEVRCSWERVEMKQSLGDTGVFINVPKWEGRARIQFSRLAEEMED